MSRVNSRFNLVFILLISLTTLLILPTTSSASEVGEESEDVTLDKTQVEDSVGIGIKQPSNEVSPNFVNPYRYSKENVRYSYEWSAYRRVSDNIRTGSRGGSIRSNRTTKFSPTVSGSIQGLNISLGGSVSSSIGYTLHAAPNRTQYMGYRVRYRVERGTRVRTDVVTGAKTRNSYTIKRPQYGEYRLLNAR